MIYQATLTEVLDFWAFAQIAQKAGLIPSPLVVEEDGAA